MNQDAPQRRIVVGVHGSAGSLTALRWAAREAELLGAHVHVVRAWEHEARWVAPYARRVSRPGREEAGAVAGAALEEAVQLALGPTSPVPVTVEVAEGLAARVLRDRAVGAEFLVLGAAARQPGDGIGPVARVCLRHAPCPVVVVSAEMARHPVPA